MRTSANPRTATAVAVALTAGACAAVQPKINALLAVRAGSAFLATLVNFAVALCVVGVVLALRPATRRTLRELPSWPVPRWTLTAGLGGALIATSGTLAVATIGVAVFSVAFFAGQITFGLLVDRIGVGPGGRRPVTAARVQAALAAVAAVVVSQIGRPVGEFSPALVALVVTAGTSLAFQSAFNGRITVATGDAFAPTAVNVAVGAAALAVLVGALALSGRVEAPHWPGQPWLYAGGVLGVTIVLSLAIATPVLGVLRATLALLAAQLVTAFAVDWVVAHKTPTPGVIVGAALILGAVGLVGRKGPT